MSIEGAVIVKLDNRYSAHHENIFELIKLLEDNFR